MHDGAITEFCAGYFEDGRRIFSSPVTSGLEALVEAGYLHLQSSRPLELENSPRLEDHVNLSVAERTRRVALTVRGVARYTELCARECAATQAG